MGGNYPLLGGGLVGVVLIIYTIGLLKQLLSNQTNITCGCGGLIGNHQINWYMVFRNLALISLTVPFYINEGIGFNFKNIAVYSIPFLGLVFHLYIIEFFTIAKKLKERLNHESVLDYRL